MACKMQKKRKENSILFMAKNKLFKILQGY